MTRHLVSSEISSCVIVTLEASPIKGTDIVSSTTLDFFFSLCKGANCQGEYDKIVWKFRNGLTHMFLSILKENARKRNLLKFLLFLS